MPQPLSRVKPKALKQTHPGVFAEMPELAVLAMQIIAAWAHTENTLGRILAGCLHADSAASLSMYFALSGGEARRAALEAAAGNSLDKADLEIFRLVMKAIKPVRDRRNELAHGLWSKSRDLPGALLWQDSGDDVREFHDSINDVEPADRRIMVFREEDLSNDLRDAEEAMSAVTCLWFLISNITAERRYEILETLKGLSLVAKHIAEK